MMKGDGVREGKGEHSSMKKEQVSQYLQKKNTHFERVSTPLSLYVISTPICSSSLFKRATRSFAKFTSCFRRSGSYFVLPTLELEFTAAKGKQDKTLIRI